MAEVVVNFECLKSLPMNDFDMVKISASVKNTSENTNNFALKCVLDTVFGENKKYHFYKRISRQYRFRHILVRLHS